MRRNFQRLSQGALTSTVSVVAPITNSGGIGLNYSSTSGLAVVAGALKILLDGTTLAQSASGLKVNVIAESQVTNLVTDLASKVPSTRLINTTAPLQGGGDLSADRTLSITQASSTTNGYLSSTDWTTFNSKGSGGTTLTAADASIQFPTSTTISVLPYHGLSTESGGLALYSDAASALGPQVTVSVTLNSTSAHTTRVGVAAFVSSTSTGLTQANNAVFGDFTLGDGSGSHVIALYQGSTVLSSTTVVNHTSSTALSVCNLVIHGAVASLMLNGSTMVSALIGTNDFAAVGFYGDSSASVARIRAWGASTGTVTFVNDRFDPGTYNTSQTLAVQNANYESFSLTGGFGNPANIFNSSTNTERTQPPSSTAGSEGLAINTNSGQAYVWKPSRTTHYEWGVAIAASSGLQIGTTGLSVRPLDTSLSTGIDGLTVTGFQPLANDPSNQFTGQSWFNSTSGLVKTNLITSTTTLPANLVTLFWGGANSSVIQNTTTKIDFTPSVTIPAGFFNVAGRAVRLTAVLGQNYTSGNFTFGLDWGTTPIWSTNFATAASNTWIEILVTTTATGSSGSFLAVGRTGGASQAQAFANFATTINLTTANALQFFGKWSVASSTNQAQVSYWTAELIE